MVRAKSSLPLPLSFTHAKGGSPPLSFYIFPLRKGIPYPSFPFYSGVNLRRLGNCFPPPKSRTERTVPLGLRYSSPPSNRLREIVSKKKFSPLLAASPGDKVPSSPFFSPLLPRVRRSPFFPSFPFFLSSHADHLVPRVPCRESILCPPLPFFFLLVENRTSFPPSFPLPS